MLSAAPAIALPHKLAITGSRLWIRDAAGDPSLHVLDARTGEILRSLGRRGQGPGEVQASISMIQSDPRLEGAVWGFDSRPQRLTRFELEGLPRGRTMVDIEGGAHLMEAAWSNGIGIGVSRYPQRRFSIFDRSGDVLRVAPGDMLADESVPMAARVEATATFFDFCVRPTGPHFSITYGHAGKIAIYEPDHFSVTWADVPQPFEPTFVRDEDEGELVFRSGDNLVAYVDCAATAGHLYALFSGKEYTFEGRNDESILSHEVHVFDWSGDLVRVLMVNPPLTGITVDEAEETLYGASLADARVHRYRMSDGESH